MTLLTDPRPKHHCALPNPYKAPRRSVFLCNICGRGFVCAQWSVDWWNIAEWHRRPLWWLWLTNAAYRHQG